jgi:hypothetical protein
MMKTILIPLVLLLCNQVIPCIAQTAKNPSLDFSLISCDQNVTISSVQDKNLLNSFRDNFSLQTKKKLYYFEDNTKKTKSSKRGKVPAIGYGLGAGVLYFVANKLAYGSLDNATFRGLFLSIGAGMVVGIAINLSKD